MPSTALMPPLNVRTRPSASMPYSALTPPLCRFDALLRPRGSGEGLEEGADRFSRPLVHEPAVFVEVLPRDWDGDLRLFDDDGPGIEQVVARLSRRTAG